MVPGARDEKEVTGCKGARGNICGGWKYVRARLWWWLYNHMPLLKFKQKLKLESLLHIMYNSIELILKTCLGQN